MYIIYRMKHGEIFIISEAGISRCCVDHCFQLDVILLYFMLLCGFGFFFPLPSCLGCTL